MLDGRRDYAKKFKQNRAREEEKRGQEIGKRVGSHLKLGGEGKLVALNTCESTLVCPLSEGGDCVQNVFLEIDRPH